MIRFIIGLGLNLITYLPISSFALFNPTLEYTNYTGSYNFNLQHQCDSLSSDVLITVTCSTRLISLEGEAIDQVIIESISNISNESPLTNNIQLGLTFYANNARQITYQTSFLISRIISSHTAYVRQELENVSFQSNEYLPGSTLCFKSEIPFSQLETFQNAGYLNSRLDGYSGTRTIYDGEDCQ